MGHIPNVGVEGLVCDLERFPSLERLSLKFYYKFESLTEWGGGKGTLCHKDTLEELSYAARLLRLIGAGGNADSGIYWSQFFTSLVSACAARLRRFGLFGSVMSMSNEQQLGEEENRQVPAMLRQDATRILFSYVSVDPDEWMLFSNWEECFGAFLKGEDGRSWDRLIGVGGGKQCEEGRFATRESKGCEVCRFSHNFGRGINRVCEDG